MTGSLGETPLSAFHDQLAINFLGAVSVTKGKRLGSIWILCLVMHAR